MGCILFVVELTITWWSVHKPTLLRSEPYIGGLFRNPPYLLYLACYINSHYSTWHLQSNCRLFSTSVIPVILFPLVHERQKCVFINLLGLAVKKLVAGHTCPSIFRDFIGSKHAVWKYSSVLVQCQQLSTTFFYYSESVFLSFPVIWFFLKYCAAPVTHIWMGGLHLKHSGLMITHAAWYYFFWR